MYAAYGHTTPQFDRPPCCIYNDINLPILNLEAEPSTSIKKSKTHVRYMDHWYGTRCQLPSGSSKDMELPGDNVEYYPGNACQPTNDPSLVWITHQWWIRESTDALWNPWTWYPRRSTEWWNREPVVTTCSWLYCYVTRTVRDERGAGSEVGKRTGVRSRRMRCNRHTYCATRMVISESVILDEVERTY